MGQWLGVMRAAWASCRVRRGLVCQRGGRTSSSPPCWPVCLQHFTVKINEKAHTRQKKGRKKNKTPNRPTWAPSAGLGQGLGLGYLLLLFPGSCWCQICIYHKQRQHNVIILLLSLSPLFLLPPQTRTLTQNDGSLDSLNEQSPRSAS